MFFFNYMRFAWLGYLDPQFKLGYTCYTLAGVAELADAHDSKSCSFGIVGSIPTFGTLSRVFLCSFSLNPHFPIK